MLPRVGIRVVKKATIIATKPFYAGSRPRQYSKCASDPVINKAYVPFTTEAELLVKKAFEKLQLTMRSYHKLIKVGRTIADLEGKRDYWSISYKGSSFYRSLIGDLTPK